MDSIPKYRAWHKQEQKMYPVISIDLDPEFGGIWKWGKGYHDHDTGEYEADKDFIAWEHIELMQWTGRRDGRTYDIYDGHDIYTGDIIGFPPEECVEGYAASHRAIVRYGVVDIGANGHEFDYIVNGFYAELAGEPDEQMTEFMNEGKLSVLGNIWQNPNLATSKQA